MTQFLAILANQKGDLNSCLPNCSSSGVCSLRNGLIGCQCFEYFTGSSCKFDTRPCSSSPCLNNATCTNSLNATFASFECECQQTFYGLNCENQINICKMWHAMTMAIAIKIIQMWPNVNVSLVFRATNAKSCPHMFNLYKVFNWHRQ